MRNDPFDGGQQAYKDVKARLLEDQRWLCAYCESRFDANKPQDQRVEHFHPKSDRSTAKNWAFDWSNVWLVCSGDSDQRIKPVEQNLTCDSYKNYSRGRLPSEGYLLAPNEVPAFPLLFKYSPEGSPEPHLENCLTITFHNNHYSDSPTLVTKTIEYLNLTCPRLNNERRIVRAQLEKRLEIARKSGRSMLDVIKSLFSDNPTNPWPAYFSLLRYRLGETAELYLREIHFEG